MPIPKPNDQESNKDFVARCMSSEVMKKEYPDNGQRVAICLGQTNASILEQVCYSLEYQDESEELSLSNVVIPEDADYIDFGEPEEEYDLLSLAAEYQGRKVKLNKPFRTPSGPKKFAVYVQNDKGKVVIVRFGDPNMKIKKNIPERRKSFRARHNCDNPGPKWKARYWSCKAW